MVYSGIFAPEGDTYPLVCIHEAVTGEPCPSCGLSHGFSLILRGRIGEALDWNPYSVRIFLFFSLQLLLRIVLSFRFIAINDIRARNYLIASDSVVTSVMFLIAFLPMMKFIVRSALSLI